MTESIDDHGGEHCLTCVGFTPDVPMVDHQFWCQTLKKMVNAGRCESYAINLAKYHRGDGHAYAITDGDELDEIFNSITKSMEEMSAILTKPKASIDIGNIVFYIPKKLSWFHRLMMRWFFGWKCANITEDDE